MGNLVKQIAYRMIQTNSMNVEIAKNSTAKITNQLLYIKENFYSTKDHYTDWELTESLYMTK